MKANIDEVPKTLEKSQNPLYTTYYPKLTEYN